MDQLNPEVASDNPWTPSPDDDAPTAVSEASVVLPLQRRAPVESGRVKAGAASTAERYHALEQLGAGGMGEVRLCRDQYIGREVAVKALLPRSAGRADLRARFEREALVQGQLEHPAIVPVYDVGFGPDGVEYFTMKRVRGHTFKQILHGLQADEPAFRGYTQRKLLGAFNQAALAIAYAHARGVVHRDLKPSNVMVGDFGEVYVLDWGIAKVLSEREAETEAVGVIAPSGDATQAGQVLGTPGYMAPEMVVATLGPVDGRSDVYALGAILFALLTLRPLHEGSIDEKMRATVEGAEARPSRRAPGANVPPELEAICVRATALRPADRYADVRAMVDDIERYLDGDRDTEQRRRLAAEHVAAARAAAERGRQGDPDLASRAEAIREVNRALALEPTNRDALSAMLQLLTEPPPGTPPEVEATLSEAATRERRKTERIGALIYLAWALLMLFLFVLGVRSLPAWGATTVLVTVAALIARWGGRLSERNWLVPAALIFTSSTAAIVSASLIFGPFVLVPAVALSNTVIIGLHTPVGWMRRSVIATGVLAPIIALAIEHVGLLPPSTAFSAAGLTILPRMVDFPPGLTVLFLLLSNVALILLPSLLMMKVRDDARAAQRRLHVHLWHLRQLVPDVPPPGSARGRPATLLARTA